MRVRTRCLHAVRTLLVRCSCAVRALFVRCLCERELTRELRDAPVCRAPHTVPTTRMATEPQPQPPPAGAPRRRPQAPRPALRPPLASKPRLGAGDVGVLLRDRRRRRQGGLGPFNFSMPGCCCCCCVPPAGTSKGQASCEGATLPPLVEALALGVTVVVQVGDVSTEPAHRGLRHHLVGSQSARCLRKPPSRATGRRPPLKRDVASLGRHCASQHHRVGLCQ